MACSVRTRAPGQCAEHKPAADDAANLRVHGWAGSKKAECPGKGSVRGHAIGEAPPLDRADREVATLCAHRHEVQLCVVPHTRCGHIGQLPDPAADLRVEARGVRGPRGARAEPPVLPKRVRPEEGPQLARSRRGADQQPGRAVQNLGHVHRVGAPPVGLQVQAPVVPGVKPAVGAAEVSRPVQQVRAPGHGPCDGFPRPGGDDAHKNDQRQ
mmetsp:Transcript_46958/g.133998  ORF Transcript_46958/g.133998 Transcript_46958/m.133998 type:complete len:212 (+) Transcript_46958:2416-3051(+)